MGEGLGGRVAFVSEGRFGVASLVAEGLSVDGVTVNRARTGLTDQELLAVEGGLTMESI